MALPTARVFPQTVTTLTVLKDFLRAGLACLEVVKNPDGNPIMIGKGKRQRPKTRIVAEDSEGRVIDLHAMRTMLGTRLARAGVAPQIAQRIMRHADYRTTLKHYTVLGLSDTAAAIERLPTIRSDDRQVAMATGTDHATPDSDPQLYPQQLARETVLSGAGPRRDERASGDDDSKHGRSASAARCETTRRAATMRGESAGVAQLVEHQPSKLNVVGSSPIARFR